MHNASRAGLRVDLAGAGVEAAVVLGALDLAVDDRAAGEMHLVRGCTGRRRAT